MGQEILWVGGDAYLMSCSQENGGRESPAGARERPIDIDIYFAKY